MPNVFSPSSASPESFRRMRLKADFLAAAANGAPLVVGRRAEGAGSLMLLRDCDRREIGFRGLDLLADLEAREAAHHDVLLQDSDLGVDDVARDDLDVRPVG